MQAVMYAVCRQNGNQMEGNGEVWNMGIGLTLPPQSKLMDT